MRFLRAVFLILFVIGAAGCVALELRALEAFSTEVDNAIHL